ncbi:hypothetical protein [Hymenobacter sp. YC55]|nr:hypothetical protein [Hymenobacter sp. YC55]MDF7815051.1 hypothetical protein [Hymenobacter sp. YC55]
MMQQLGGSFGIGIVNISLAAMPLLLLVLRRPKNSAPVTVSLSDH